MNSLYEPPPIVASSSHTVMFHLPLSEGVPPKPCSKSLADLLSWKVVKMPHSNKQKWQLICKQYAKPCRNFEDLRAAILSYNKYNEEDASFFGLQKFFDKMNDESKTEFFEDLLPKIIGLALSLPHEVKKPIPLLKKNSSLSISLSQKQIGVLLANAFLCTFSHREVLGEICGAEGYPDINFNRLFGKEDEHVQEKFKCIFNYFKRITEAEPDGVVTFTRQSFSQFPDFSSSAKQLPALHLKLDGLIEEADNHLQVDFADEYIGGLIFTAGCIQEEIRFLLCPELIISRLFTEILQENEAIIVTGVERHNVGTGYSRNFKFVSSFNDPTPRDGFRRRRCQMVAIDAINFNGRMSEQFRPANILREIRKAYAGFYPLTGTRGPLTPVATGNWGCGAFCGRPTLKILLQLIAAGEAGRDVTYFTFRSQHLVSSAGALYDYLKEKGVTIGQLTSILLSFGEERAKGGAHSLYDYIRQQVLEANHR